MYACTYACTCISSVQPASVSVEVVPATSLSPLIAPPSPRWKIRRCRKVRPKDAWARVYSPLHFPSPVCHTRLQLRVLEQAWNPRMQVEAFFSRSSFSRRSGKRGQAAEAARKKKSELVLSSEATSEEPQRLCRRSKLTWTGRTGNLSPSPGPVTRPPVDGPGANRRFWSPPSSQVLFCSASPPNFRGRFSSVALNSVRPDHTSESGSRFRSPSRGVCASDASPSARVGPRRLHK